MRKETSARLTAGAYSFAEPNIADTSGVPASTRPPFGYYGAKQRIASHILPHIPPHNAWVEAFCGSAAITLAKEPAPIEVINDLDGNIVNLFKLIRENQEELCRAVALTPYSREEYQESRRDMSSHTPLENARRFLVTTMMAVNGTISPNRVGFSFSQAYAREGREARVNRWYNLPERISEVAERLRSVRIENRDARDLVRMFSHRPATVVYLDPPYFIKREHGYSIDAKEQGFHEELLALLNRAKSMILLSGYETPLYNNMLPTAKGWERVEISAESRDTQGRRYAKTEVLWKNKYAARALHTGRVPIRLSRKEKLNNKVNPSRGS